MDSGVDETLTVCNMQGWDKILEAGYGLRKFIMIIVGGVYVSGDTNEDSGFLWVTF